MGNYLKYNNPHKLSLYVASGIPVITWNQAAIAEFIQENDIGFTVDGIDQISTKISQLNEKVYSRYCKNILKLQDKAIKGEYTSHAILSLK